MDKDLLIALRGLAAALDDDAYSSGLDSRKAIRDACDVLFSVCSAEIEKIEEKENGQQQQ